MNGFSGFGNSPAKQVKTTGTGPRATVKRRGDDGEKEDATLEAMENSSNFDGKSEMEINKAKKENAKKYTSDDEEQAYENAQNDFDTDNPTKAQLAKALKEIKAGN